MPSVRGLNHVTLAVADVPRSISFYRDVLGCRQRANWKDGAYREAGPLWLCLSQDDEARTRPHPDYTHLAFDVAKEDHGALRARIIAAAPLWRTNASEGASTYFLDLDEINVGSLASRLAHYRRHPKKGVEIIDDPAGEPAAIKDLAES